MKCPQCGSAHCGEYICRFTGVTQAQFRQNQYADTMIKRDKEQPAWLRNVLTGGRDPNAQ